MVASIVKTGTLHFEVLAWDFANFKASILTLPKALRGSAEIKVTGSRFVKHEASMWADRFEIFSVVYTGPVALVCEGWTLAGITDWLGGDKSVTRLFPTAPEGIARPVAPTCDKCGKVRSRKQTLTVYNEVGEVMHLGGECAKQFTGGVTVSALLAAFDAFKSIANRWTDGLGGGEGNAMLGQAGAWELDTVLALAMDVISESGYQKDGVTKSDVLSGLRKRVTPKATAESVAKLKALVAEKAPVSNYWDTVKEIFALPAVPLRMLGYAVSAVAGAARLDAPSTVSEWVGEEGKRTEATLTLVGRYQNDWGYTTRFVDGVGNAIVCFGKLPEYWEIKEAKKVSFFVKKHDLYNGNKSTVINRLKMG